jgi:hypothetical protein
MEKVKLGMVIAERTLFSPKKLEVRVRIGAPQKTTADDYITPYQIVGAGDEEVRFAAGLDSVQSLHLALQMVAADINYGLKDYELRWADSDDSGFRAP